MGRGFSKTGPTLSSPVWAQDFLSRDHLVPTPAKVDAANAGFVAVNGKKKVLSGTVVGRTKAQALAGAKYLPVADTHDEVRIVVWQIDDALDIDDVELYRPNSAVKVNFLPQWATLTAVVKGKLQDQYICILGVA
jgi:hypothetical protein